jgi:hypothetical protein
MCVRFSLLLLGCPAPILAQHLDTGMLPVPVYGYDPAGFVQGLVVGLHFEPVLGHEHGNIGAGSDMVRITPLHWECDSSLIIDFTGELLHNTY